MGDPREAMARARQAAHELGLRPKKRLGQHFLVDHHQLERIARACELQPDDYVVEIGPGWGFLTAYLAERARGVLAVEVDQALAPVLEAALAGYPNVRLLFADVLRVDLEDEVRRAFSLQGEVRFAVCANLPYYITTPIIFALLERARGLQSAVVMVQREVAERLVARPGSADYGLLTVMVAYRARVEMVGRVPAACFWPRPEVESAVVRLVPHRQPPVRVEDEQRFRRLVRTAFQKRRKTMLNIVAAAFEVDKARGAACLQRAGIDAQRRPETLSLEEFARVADCCAP